MKRPERQIPLIEIGSGLPLRLRKPKPPPGVCFVVLGLASLRRAALHPNEGRQPLVAKKAKANARVKQAALPPLHFFSFFARVERPQSAPAPWRAGTARAFRLGLRLVGAPRKGAARGASAAFYRPAAPCAGKRNCYYLLDLNIARASQTAANLTKQVFCSIGRVFHKRGRFAIMPPL